MGTFQGRHSSKNCGLGGFVLAHLKDWVNERWPLSPIIRLALEEEIHGGAHVAYALGSAILVAFALQAITGCLQLFFYVPTTDHAYDSISYLRTLVPFGWLIHGLHYWGAQIMVVLVMLHVARVFLWGAYKPPREVTWLAGVTLLMVTMAFSVTGDPLHWDQRGYWVGDVSTSVAGTIPLAGDLMKRFLRGGEEMGQLALSRLFGFHTAVLPITLIVLFSVHIVAMRRSGSVGPWNEEKRKRKGFFWPDQVFRDATVGTAVFLLLLFLVVFVPPRYSGPADPLDVSYIPKPEWNFLFLYQSLKYFQGPLEPVGTVGVPTILTLILVLLPFLDRNPERNPLRRPVALALGIAFAAILFTLSIIGYLSPGFTQAPSQPETTSIKKGLSVSVNPKHGFLTSESEASPRPKDAISSPVSAATGAQASSTSVPPVPRSPGQAAYFVGSVERGGELFKTHCSPCHGSQGVSVTPNPGSTEGKVPNLHKIAPELYSSDAQTFAENIDVYIQHGSVPEGPNPALRMPAFGDTNSLTQPEIANIESYVLQINGVDRAQLVNPGMQPRTFFLLVVAVFGIMALAMGGLWNKKQGTLR